MRPEVLVSFCRIGSARMESLSRCYGVDLCDMIFKCPAGSRNFRLGGRPQHAQHGAFTFQIGGTNTEQSTLAVGDTAASLSKALTCSAGLTVSGTTSTTNLTCSGNMSCNAFLCGNNATIMGLYKQLERFLRVLFLLAYLTAPMRQSGQQRRFYAQERQLP